MGARFAGTFLVFEECPLGQKMGTLLEDEERPQSAYDLLWRRHLVTPSRHLFTSVASISRCALSFANSSAPTLCGGQMTRLCALEVCASSSFS